MTTENSLKTLKDITPIPKDMEVDTWTSTRALKEEAIKWVKDIDTDLFKVGRQKRTRIPVGLIANRQWIMQFFNITEEDLL